MSVKVKVNEALSLTQGEIIAEIQKWAKADNPPMTRRDIINRLVSEGKPPASIYAVDNAVCYAMRTGKIPGSFIVSPMRKAKERNANILVEAKKHLDPDKPMTDALDGDEIRKRVEDAIKSIINWKRWKASEKKQEVDRRWLAKLPKGNRRP